MQPFLHIYYSQLILNRNDIINIISEYYHTIFNLATSKNDNTILYLKATKRKAMIIYFKFTANSELK